MSRGNFFEELFSSRWWERLRLKDEEEKKRDEERRKSIIKVCEAECANCDNWDRQKQCSSCEIFKALSEAKRC